MRSCNCLNIEIEAEGNVFDKVNEDCLNLNEDEKKESFFKQDIQKVKKLVNINKAISGLVQTKIVGSWLINRCVNCDVETHAVHREEGAACVLINSHLLEMDAVLKLKSSGLVSSIYNIVIYPNNIETGDSLIQTYLFSPETQQTIKSIGQVVSEVLRKETLATEDRIRKYKEKQYDLLNRLKDQAFKEQQSLVSVARIKLNNIFESTHLNSRNIKVETTPKMVNLSTNKQAPSTVLPLKFTPKRQKSTTISHAASFDSEGLFEFEEIDEAINVQNSDLEESDKEGKDESTKINRCRSGSISIAKSLPVNIPTFLSSERFEDNKDIEENLMLQQPINIAANIQALAKSVHGDAVFGDLPRPRFSMQY
ncbi:unnamed protein product [Brassicogethes aeneus]|uniref:Uncharacterized protein n=1 Tax=Brassicogethes aeneus TaxID=1431903 RepID=A0A9P0BAM4_BRAAE|nr:unnamed protein product [Brassicogethes aeneus]